VPVQLLYALHDKVLEPVCEPGTVLVLIYLAATLATP
jgi:hypothetical protein